MSDTLQAVARALAADVQQLSAVGHNVANINTPGYRGVRVQPGFEPARFDPAGAAQPGAMQIGADPLAATQTRIDQRNGTLMQTARSLDLALQGEGFFAVERAGRTLLTRSGAFRVDADGALVNAFGDRVLGESGPILLGEPGAAAGLRVDANGELWSADRRSLGRLDLVAAADAAALRPAGDGAYAYEGERGQWRGRVVQGALESANVDAAAETLRLIETTRHAESVQRAISIYDKAMDAGINRIGDN
ncbi:flagellar basal-body rod protein FlgF [Lysobacter enzymogenes]|uniref:flagellar hook-basal body protein n=1 Tax=Lysobacter enzymogenes TaxID=69 RepID=UPI00339419D5